MIAKETERRTDKVHKDMDEVIVNSGPLSAVARNVQDVNETLAIHAAWTEERFDGVEERLGGLELGQQNIRADIAGLSTRVDRLDIKVDRLDTRVDRLDAKVDRLDAKVDQLDTKVDGLTFRVGNLETAFVGMRADMVTMKDQIRDDIDKLAVRMDRVISFAIKDELKLAEAEGEEDTKE